MSMVLLNPTSETLEMQFGGKTIYLEPGAQEKVDDATGKHMLNGFTSRGLCSLEFGDTIDEVSAAGIQRNIDFKKRMVMQHNHRNVVRKQQGLSYTEPTPYIREAAALLGIALDEPYAPRDKEQDRVKDLERQVEKLMGMVSSLLSGGSEVSPRVGKGKSSKEDKDDL